MKYSLIRETKNPSRANQHDAGVDVFVPTLTNQFLKVMEDFNNKEDFSIVEHEIFIHPFKRIKLPTGVIFNTPINNMLLVLQKTSIPNKTGIISGARCIDASYRGQFIASLINTSNQNAKLQQGQKFIQVVLVPINQDYTLLETPISCLFEGRQQSSRNTGGFGSSGKY